MEITAGKDETILSYAAEQMAKSTQIVAILWKLDLISFSLWYQYFVNLKSKRIQVLGGRNGFFAPEYSGLIFFIL